MPNARLIPAVNATGILLHTGLGRAVLPEAARAAMARIAQGYCTLEIDALTGKRGSRHDAVSEILRELTGAEASIVVNNNAAAVMLLLHALARDRDVVVSRGHLVEIGGSFRMPDVMTESGARLVSVGATNQVTIEDYRSALTDRTALIMAVHRSNFEIRGQEFTTPMAELIALGRAHGVPVAYDLGSGLMVDPVLYGLPPEPTVPESVRAGVDITCFSGDKMLGGPQAGILVGSSSLIEKIKKDPLMRVFRTDKVTLAGLQTTLELFRNPERLTDTHPLTRMLTTSIEELEKRASGLVDGLRVILGDFLEITVDASTAEIGGGAFPSAVIPSRAIVMACPGGSIHAVADAFRHGTPPVFGRLSGAFFLLDVRTILPGDTPHVLSVARGVRNLFPGSH